MLQPTRVSKTVVLNFVEANMSRTFFESSSVVGKIKYDFLKAQVYISLPNKMNRPSDTR